MPTEDRRELTAPAANLQSSAEKSGKKLPAWWLITLMFAVGINLRGALGSVPPLLDDIGADLALSGAAQGSLTSLAIVFMAISAPSGPLLGRRLGNERALSLLLLILAGGEFIRLWATSLPVLLASIAVAGCAMGASSTLIPPLIAAHLTSHQGLATGVFTAGTALGVAIAAGTAVPLADLFGEWQSALATWALVAILTVVAWHGTVVRGSTAATASLRAKIAPRQKFSYRTVTPWLVTFYAATPMVIGFTIVAWISPFYLSAGLPDQSAANRLVTFQIAQLLSMMLLPLLAERLRDLRILLAAPLVLACGGVGLLLADPRFLDPLAVIMLGLGVGGTTALGLFLIPVISTSVGVAGQLSGMVFTVAFTASAVGPVTLGALRDLTDSYTIGFVALLALGVLALGSVLALRPGRVVDPVGQPPGQV